jgi:hypothetical protein
MKPKGGSAAGSFRDDLGMKPKGGSAAGSFRDDASYASF